MMIGETRAWGGAMMFRASELRANVYGLIDAWRDGGPAAKLAGRSLKRLQDPEDLIGACLYFASADSDFTTGQTLVIDGGGAMW